VDSSRISRRTVYPSQDRMSHPAGPAGQDVSQRAKGKALRRRSRHQEGVARGRERSLAVPGRAQREAGCGNRRAAQADKPGKGQTQTPPPPAASPELRCVT